jgi:hypothetical protein
MPLCHENDVSFNKFLYILTLYEYCDYIMLGFFKVYDVWR